MGSVFRVSNHIRLKGPETEKKLTQMQKAQKVKGSKDGGLKTKAQFCCLKRLATSLNNTQRVCVICYSRL